MGNTCHGAQIRPKLTLAVSGENAGSVSGKSDDLTAVQNFLSREIEDRLGENFSSKMPTELMQLYCLATVRNNEPTAALLYELLTNFMKAYANPESNADALKAFDYLAHLAGKSAP